MKKLKVAFFVGEFPVLSETFVIRQVAGFISAGHEVTVIAGKWGDRACAHEVYVQNRIAERVNVIRKLDSSTARDVLSALRFLAVSIVRPNAWRRLRAAVDAYRSGSRASTLDIAALTTDRSSAGGLGVYDFVIAHFGPAGVRAMYLQKAGLLGGPIATVFHGFDMSNHDVVKKCLNNYKSLFENTRRLLPISEVWKKRLIEWGAPPEKITTLRMGVDVDELKILNQDRPPAEPLRVLSVARLTEKKGLIYAIEGVKQANTSIHYEIIGSGPLESLLVEAASYAPAGKKIVFLGSRNQQEVFEALSRADVFLLPSITAETGDMEGIPVSLMEAMAMGVVVVATRHSGNPELVENEVSGYLVEERDVGAIAATLDRVSSEREQIGAIRRAARKKIEDEFDNKKLDELLIELASAQSSALST